MQEKDKQSKKINSCNGRLQPLRSSKHYISRPIDSFQGIFRSNMRTGRPKGSTVGGGRKTAQWKRAVAPAGQLLRGRRGSLPHVGRQASHLEVVRHLLRNLRQNVTSQLVCRCLQIHKTLMSIRAWHTLTARMLKAFGLKISALLKNHFMQKTQKHRNKAVASAQIVGKYLQFLFLLKQHKAWTH